MIDDELVMKVQEDYCIGHLNYHIPEWCPRCIYDEKNRLCLGYQHIKLTLIEIIEKKDDLLLPLKNKETV